MKVLLIINDRADVSNSDDRVRVAVYNSRKEALSTMVAIVDCDAEDVVDGYLWPVGVPRGACNGMYVGILQVDNL